MYVRVTGTPFVRDTRSMALSNTDQIEKNDYYLKRQLLMRQKNEINIINKEISDLKDDMLEIKTLLKTLIEK